MPKPKHYSQYKCPACQDVVIRADNNSTRESFCVKKGKKVILKKVRWNERIH